jgi:hypothetical protein
MKQINLIGFNKSESDNDGDMEIKNESNQDRSDPETDNEVGGIRTIKPIKIFLDNMKSNKYNRVVKQLRQDLVNFNLYDELGVKVENKNREDAFGKTYDVNLFNYHAQYNVLHLINSQFSKIGCLELGDVFDDWSKLNDITFEYTYANIDFFKNYFSRMTDIEYTNDKDACFPYNTYGFVKLISLVTKIWGIFTFDHSKTVSNCIAMNVAFDELQNKFQDTESISISTYDDETIDDNKTLNECNNTLNLAFYIPVRDYNENWGNHFFLFRFVMYNGYIVIIPSAKPTNLDQNIKDSVDIYEFESLIIDIICLVAWATNYTLFWYTSSDRLKFLGTQEFWDPIEDQINNYPLGGDEMDLYCFNYSETFFVKLIQMKRFAGIHILLGKTIADLEDQNNQKSAAKIFITHLLWFLSRKELWNYMISTDDNQSHCSLDFALTKK